MKKVSREQALNLLACIELIGYSEEKIRDILNADYLDEEGESRAYDDIYSQEVQFFLIEYIKRTNIYGVTNKYLETVLNDVGYTSFSIQGNPPELETCPCCDYRTLKKRGEYEVCRVCFWEDEGRDISGGDYFSQTNKINLENARNNFNRVGACSENALPFVDPKGVFKFDR